MSNMQHVSLWNQSPALPLLETRPEGRHTLIFIGGLSDTLAVVPYLAPLAEAIAGQDFGLVQPQLSSSLGGYGLSSLEADAQEVCLVIDHLRSRTINRKPADGKIVIMGHSTGCQDIVQLLSYVRLGFEVDGAILQAPLSDREDFEAKNTANSTGQEMLQMATQLMEQGKGDTLLPRVSGSPLRQPTEKYAVNVAAFQRPAMTAYRFWSLYAKGGDDDFFSSDLSVERLKQIWTETLHRGRQVLVILGEKDEYYPPGVLPQHLAQSWIEAAADSIHYDAIVVPGANHKVESSQAQKVLIDAVKVMLGKVTKAERQSVAPSFDEIVDLISTGKAESIPGVKTIPLKINEAKPSASKMERPAKPWERSRRQETRQDEGSI